MHNENKKKKTLRPLNRHLVVEPHIERNQTNTGVLLPDDYEPEHDRFVPVTVKGVSEDCGDLIDSLLSPPWTSGDRVAIVDRSMIHEISLKDEKFHVILENYVVGILE